MVLLPLETAETAVIIVTVPQAAVLGILLLFTGELVFAQMHCPYLPGQACPCPIVISQYPCSSPRNPVFSVLRGWAGITGPPAVSLLGLEGPFLTVPLMLHAPFPLNIPDAEWVVGWVALWTLLRGFDFKNL